MQSINLTPSWEETMSIYIAALENGNQEGKELARKKLMKLAKHLDTFFIARKELPKEKLAEPQKHFIIRKVS